MNEFLKIGSSNVMLILLFVTSIIAGLGMLIVPESTPALVIRGIGLLWIFEGVIFGLELWKRKLEKKLKKEE